MKQNLSLLLFIYLLVCSCHLNADTNQNNQTGVNQETIHSKPWTTFVLSSAILPILHTTKLYFYDGDKQSAVLLAPFAVMTSIWSSDGISRIIMNEGLNNIILVSTSLINLSCVLGTGLYCIKRSIKNKDFIKATLLQNLGIFIAFLVPYSIAQMIDGR